MTDLPQEYFDKLYQQSDDPWGFEDRFYERRKRELLLAILPRTRFARGFEPGCSTGALSAGLAGRCDELTAWDVSWRALEQADSRSLGNVSFELKAFPEQRPEGLFDLVVISEMGYYVGDLGELVRAVDEVLTEDGVLVACHWRHPAPGYPQTAEAVHAA